MCIRDRPRVDRVGKAQVLNAELVTSDGYVATASFETPWFLQLGNYYDVEVRSTEGGDCAFLVSKTPPQGTSSSASWFSDNIFGISGRYGAYGAPQDVRVLRDERDRSLDGGRLLEYSFTALKGNAEVQRRAFVRAMTPPGSKDVVILVAGTTASRWRKENGEKTSRAVVDSLRVSSSKTNLKKDEASDYRTYKSKMPDLSPQKEGGGATYRD